MATAADLRSRVRLLLEESVAAIWTDAEVDQAVLDALGEYNLTARREVVTTATLAGDEIWTLPADCVRVVRVDLDGEIIPRRGPVTAWGDRELQAWEMFAGALQFVEAATGDLTVWYLGGYDLATLPARDEPLIVTGAALGLLTVRAIEQGKRGMADDVAPARAALAARLDELRRARGRRVRSASALDG